MTIYITDTTNGQKTIIPMLPAEIDFKATADFLSYSVMDLGQVKIPNGCELSTVSWQAIFPGKNIKNQPYVCGTWQQPDNLVKLFDKYKANGTPLQLVATDSPINMPVYISEFDVTLKASYGWDYSIEFVQRKSIQIAVMSGNASSSGTTDKSKSKAPARVSKKMTTYTVKKGDSLWKIAEKYLGSGARYTDICVANKIKSNTTIHPGQILIIP
jgi:Uncharacterized protein containing LysM domain